MEGILRAKNQLDSSSRFDTMSAFDGRTERRTDGRTHDVSKYRASIASRGKNPGKLTAGRKLKAKPRRYGWDQPITKSLHWISKTTQLHALRLANSWLLHCPSVWHTVTGIVIARASGTAQGPRDVVTLALCQLEISAAITQRIEREARPSQTDRVRQHTILGQQQQSTAAQSYF